MEVTLPDTPGEALFPTIQKGPGGQTEQPHGPVDSIPTCLEP